MTTAILKIPEVERITGLSKSTIYLYESQGKFPRRALLTGRTSGWFADEINEWLESIRRARDGQPA